MYAYCSYTLKSWHAARATVLILSSSILASWCLSKPVPPIQNLQFSSVFWALPVESSWVCSLAWGQWADVMSRQGLEVQQQGQLCGNRNGFVSSSWTDFFSDGDCSGGRESVDSPSVSFLVPSSCWDLPAAGICPRLWLAVIRVGSFSAVNSVRSLT